MIFSTDRSDGTIQNSSEHSGNSSDEEFVTQRRTGETQDHVPTDAEMEDVDGEHELDEDYDMLRLVLDSIEKEGKGGEEDSGDDGDDEDDENANGNLDSENGGSRGNGGDKNESFRYNISDEKISEWYYTELKRIDKLISSNNKKIEELQKKKANNKQRAQGKDAEHQRQYDAREKGQNELDKILEAKEKFQAQADNASQELQKTQVRLEKYRELRQAVVDNPRQEYVKCLKRKRVKMSRRRSNDAVHYSPYDLEDGNDSLSDQISTQTKKERDKRRQKREEQAKGKGKDSGKKKKGTNDGDRDTPKNPQACRRCKVSFLFPPLLSSLPCLVKKFRARA